MTTATIIIAEDDDKSRKLLVDVLTRQGYQVFAVADGTRALELARKVDPGVMLLDLQLQGLNGFEVLEALRVDEKTAALPVIAVTAAAMAGDRERISNAGFDGYHSKPVDISELLASIQQMIGQDV